MVLVAQRDMHHVRTPSKFRRELSLLFFFYLEMYIHKFTLLPSYFPYSIDMVFRACVGNEACRQGTIYAEAGHIEGVSDSCVGDFSCKGAASMGGEIQKIEYSCTMHHACKYLAGDGGSVGVISDSCEDEHSCRYAAYGGEIQVMSESCNNVTA